MIANYPGSAIQRPNRTGYCAMTMLPFAEAVFAGLSESVTVTVKFAAGPETAVVGVPVIAPVELLSVKPVGSEPDVIAKVYGPIPPVAVAE